MAPVQEARAYAPGTNEPWYPPHQGSGKMSSKWLYWSSAACWWWGARTTASRKRQIMCRAHRSDDIKPMLWVSEFRSSTRATLGVVPLCYIARQVSKHLQKETKTKYLSFSPYDLRTSSNVEPGYSKSRSRTRFDTSDWNWTARASGDMFVRARVFTSQVSHNQ